MASSSRLCPMNCLFRTQERADGQNGRWSGVGASCEDTMVRCAGRRAVVRTGRSGGRAERPAVSLNHDACWDLLRSAEHGVLCTTNAERAIDAVPVCYAVVGDLVVSPVDRIKPKTTTALKRSENLWRHPAATLLWEHWDADDWSQLWWVRVRLSFNPNRRRTSPSWKTQSATNTRTTGTRRSPISWSSRSVGLLGWSAAAD